MDTYNVKLENVRLSFPSLFRPTKGPDGNSKEAYAATFIMDKTGNAKDIERLRKAIDEVVRVEAKGKRPGKVCLRDGAEKDLDGYGPGVMFLSARSAKRPHVVNRDLTPLTEDDGIPYAGCYVTCTVRLWYQDNQFGKRVNASLRTVQFVRKGEPFGEGEIDVTKELTALPDEDEGAI